MDNQTPEFSKIRVLIVDDHPLMRGALRLTVEAERDFEVVGEAMNGAQAIEKANIIQPDTIVMDLYLPGDLDGVMSTHEILRINPTIHVMIITSSMDEAQVFRSIQAGALGFVQKDVTNEEFLLCLRQVSQGNLFLQPKIAQKMLNSSTGEHFAPNSILTESPSGKAWQAKNVFDVLTESEKKVLLLIAQGNSNKEIATNLNISVNTVTSHIQRIFSKMQFDSRVKAALFCKQHGFN